MNTTEELRAEASRLEPRGAQLWRSELQQNPVPVGVADFPTLVNFPPTRVRLSDEGAWTYTRSIAVRAGPTGPEYLLLQRGEAPYGNPFEAEPPAILAESEVVFDLLVEADQLAEEDKLTDALTAVQWNLETSYRDPELSLPEVRQRASGEVETAVELASFGAADRLRVRNEIEAYVEGRLEPSEFIERVVERKRQALDVRQTLAVGESLTNGVA